MKLSPMSAPPIDEYRLSMRDSSTSKENRKRWWIAVFFTLALHLFFFMVGPQWLSQLLVWMGPAQTQKERTRIESIDATQLQKIRDRLKKERMLLDPNDSAQVEAEDKRFKDLSTFSNKNRRVEKETRAAQAQSSVPTNRSNLSNLGVPIPGLQSRPQKNAQRGSRKAAQPGGQTGARAGSPQAFIDDSLAEGAENVLNTRSSKFYSFYARIHQAIGPLWESQAREVTRNVNLSPADYITQVEVHLNRNGQLAEVIVHRSAGVKAFDHAVVQSWKRVQHFPNPPIELLEKDGLLRMGWTFTFRYQKGSVEFVTPSRRF